jgi:integrase
MAKILTDVVVRQAKSNGKRREIPDAGCSGLRLVIQKTEQKSFAGRYRSPVERDKRGRRKPKKLTLGPLAAEGEGGTDEPRIGDPLTLADARALWNIALRQVRKGIDPARVHRVEKQEARVAQTTVEDAFALFMANHLRKKRKGTPIRESTRRKTGRLLGLEPKDGDLSTWVMCEPKSGVLAHWAGRGIGSITKADVRAVLAAMIRRGAPVAANRTLSALKQTFAWCVRQEDILETSPCDHIDAPSPEQSDERELSGAELVAIWRAAVRMGYPYGDMIRVLLLTGQRLDEVLSAVCREFDFQIEADDRFAGSRIWIIPGKRTKNGREHHVPLSNEVLAILAKLPKVESKAGYLFTLSGDVPVSNLSRLKKHLDELALEELRKINPNISELVPWKQHHMRHTLKTWMQRARIPKDVRNAVQNHHDSDMDARYGHYSFEAEKREALVKWAEHVTEIVSGASVTELPYCQTGYNILGSDSEPCSPNAQG